MRGAGGSPQKNVLAPNETTQNARYRCCEHLDCRTTKKSTAAAGNTAGHPNLHRCGAGGRANCCRQAGGRRRNGRSCRHLRAAACGLDRRGGRKATPRRLLIGVERARPRHARPRSGRRRLPHRPGLRGCSLPAAHQVRQTILSVWVGAGTRAGPGQSGPAPAISIFCGAGMRLRAFHAVPRCPPLFESC